MISTISVNKLHIDESISTCRFAQRVARVKNIPKINEVVDPYVIIAQLKSEIQVVIMQVILIS